MDIGPPALSRVTSRSRVSSPSAAKIDATLSRWPGADGWLAAASDLPVYGLQLLSPAVFVAPIRFHPTRQRDAVEARLPPRADRRLTFVGSSASPEGSNADCAAIYHLHEHLVAAQKSHAYQWRAARRMHRQPQCATVPHDGRLMNTY